MVAVGNLFLKETVKSFGLEKNHGIRILNCGSQQSFGITGCGRDDYLQAGKMGKKDLRCVRMMLKSPDSAP